MKTFTYTKITSSHCDEDYGYEFDYTVEREDLLDAVVDIVFNEYFKGCDEAVKKGLKRFIYVCDIEDELIDYYEFTGDLKEYFRQEAFEQENEL
ncbi:MAG: hypothetical protein IKB98_04455 [Clostridia bacterium]|nr:hypothetical protein [Clostridia bacterium]